MSPERSVAHYRLTSKLGEGGMGAVYRATDTRLNREVAVKVLPPVFAEDAARMQRFEREAQVLASLNHPNIAGIYGIEQGAIVMELVEGANLAGPLPADTRPDPFPGSCSAARDGPLRRTRSRWRDIHKLQQYCVIARWEETCIRRNVRRPLRALATFAGFGGSACSARHGRRELPVLVARQPVCGLRA
jgi:Protein kinase domain